MGTLYDRIMAGKNKGAETGTTASASEQSSLYSRIMENSAQNRSGQQPAQNNLYERIMANSEARKQNLYTQAIQGSRYTQSVLDQAQPRESSLQGSTYAGILRRADYAQNSQAGESKASWNPFKSDALYDYINDINGAREAADFAARRGQGTNYAKYALMTADEIGVYNYLYATQGKKAAGDYLEELEPQLNRQYYTAAAANAAQEANKNAGTQALYSLGTIAGQPVRTATSMLADAQDAIRTATGREIDPYSELRQASLMTQNVRESVARDIEEKHPGTGGKIGSFAYQTAMSAGDSLVNAWMAQGLGEAYGAARGFKDAEQLQKAVNMIGSLTMSSEVTALATAEGKEKGYSDLGALSLGLIRGGVEYLSEKWGGEWIIKRLKNNPTSLLTSLIKAMVPEGTEEVMSDLMNELINFAIDPVFGTKESYIANTYREYEAAGAKHPLAETLKTVLQQELLSFAGGAFAAAGSGTTNYRSNMKYIDAAAAQLHTDRQGVVQIMNELDTENAGAVALLAQLHDAHSTQELMERVGATKNVQQAVDMAMQQENKNAPEGAINTEGAQNGQQGNVGGSENRYAGLGAGGENTNYERRAGSVGMDAGYEGGQGRDRIENYGVKETVSPAALGITNGSANQAVEVLDEATFAEGSPEAQAAQKARQEGLEPVFIKGTMQIGEGENAKQARAWISGNRVILQADGQINADQLLNHELYHQEAQRNPELNDIIRQALANNLSREELTNLVSRYITAYDGIYDFSQMSQEEIERICEEELFADLYAGIDNTGRAKLREGAQTGFAEAQQNRQKNAEAERDTRGPPEGRAALNPSFEEEFDKWLSNGSEEYRLKDRGRFLVGITSDKLKQAGVDDYEIYFGKSKIANIMKNPEMTARVIKDAVQIVENPIIVMDSTTVPGSIVMFGDAKTDNGKPVMVSMILHPETKTGEILDYGVISSTYGRRVNNAQNLINTSSIRYIDQDKNRTDTWSKELGLQLPSSSTTSGSNNTIPPSSLESNPQNEGRASVDVTLSEAADLRRELADLEREYTEATNNDDPNYDYAGALERIKELQDRIKNQQSAEKTAAEKEEERRTARKTGTYDAEKNGDAHPDWGPIGKDGIRTVNLEHLEDELNEVGGARVSNDTGDYKVQIRKKNDGRFLATVERNGKRDIAKSFNSFEDGSAWLASYIQGQTNARTDAEMDKYKSPQEPAPELVDQLFGTANPAKEGERKQRNKAAESSTQALREQIKRTESEIKALDRLEKTTGLTDTQKTHRENLRKELEILAAEKKSRESRREKEQKEKPTPPAQQPTESTAAARRNIMNEFHIPAGRRNEIGNRIQAVLDTIRQSGHVDEESRRALFDTLIDAGVVPKQAEELYHQIRNDLSGRRIYVSEHERADFGDDWEPLRRRAWGSRIFLTNNPADQKIDTINQELAGAYGEDLFPQGGALSDMLENMMDLAERGRTTEQRLSEAIQDEARYTGMSADDIYREMFNDLDNELRTFGEKAGLEVRLKEKTATALMEERQRWENRMEQQAQRRRESKIRDKVMSGIRQLARLKNKAAPEVKAQVEEVLRDIDTQARSITVNGIENLQALQAAYEEAAKAAGYVDEENPGNFLRNPYVEEKLARLSKMQLDEMDINDVIELGRTVAGLVNTIQNNNKMIGEEFDAGIKETAEQADQEIKSSKGAKPGFLQKWFKEEQLSPRRFLEMLGGWKQGGAMQKLARSLEDGQTRMLDFQRRAVQSFDDFMSKKQNRKWLETASGKNAKWSTYGVVNGMAMDGSGYTGQKIEITPMMKISLYLHSLNEDNLRHIQTGGLVIPNKELYRQGKIKEAYAQGEKVKMQPQAVRAIASTLTQEEKTFAGYLQKFFNQQSKDAINEVSLQLDGFERAGVDNYFPIESSSSYLKSDVAGEARAQTVEGIGSIANERVHAGNPIVLSDASDVLTRQIDKVSRYYGLAIPIRNFQAVNNHVFHEEGNAFAGSIKDTINRKWGSGAENYITKMLQDIQSGGSKSDMLSTALSKLRSNLAGSTLMFNPSVAVSQMASYPGAAQAVGWDGLAAGLVAGKVDTKLMEKYTPLYWYRNQGNSTQELGDAIKDKTLEQKLPWALNWIQKMDSATVRRLWAAAEYRVSRDNPNLKPGSREQIDAGTDPYYKEVARVFNRAVYDTQPNYTDMERAQILRSDSDLTKFLTMYKTVPLQYYGMMTEAAGRLQAAYRSGSEQEQQQARKYFADTYGGILAANMVYVAIKALFKGFRKKDEPYRDEDGNLTAGSVSKQLSKDLLDVYAGSVIGGSEALTLAEKLLTGGRYNAPEISPLSFVEDMYSGVQGIIKAIDSEDPRQTAGAVKNAAETLATGAGIPAKNAETYLLSLVRWARPDWAMEFDNTFGGITKSDLAGMDAEAAAMATNIILRNRTGAKMDRTVTDELARLYGEGYREAVPTAIPQSFQYGDTTVEIEDRRAYAETWGNIVGDNLEELLTSNDYVAQDDKGRKAMIDKLYDYATVQARKRADPNYDPADSSTYSWTVKADECVASGISLPDAICAMTAIGGMYADKDANGNSISGTKKPKVMEYIDGLDLTDAQKDTLYLTVGGYKETTLDDTPWHGGSGTTSGKKGRGRSGGRKKAAAKPKAVGGTQKASAPGIDISSLFGGTRSGTGLKKASGSDLAEELARIIERYYGGDIIASAVDGGRRARVKNKVDFTL